MAATRESLRSPAWQFAIAVLAVACAFALSTALLVVHASPAVAGAASACGGGEACALAAASPWSVVPPRVGPFASDGWRPPVAALAVAHFALVGTWLVAGARRGRWFATALGLGLAASVGYTALALASPAPACPLCLGVHAANFVLCVAALRLPRTPSASSWRRSVAVLAAAVALTLGTWTAAALLASGRSLASLEAQLAGAGDLAAAYERAWLGDDRFTTDAAARERFDRWLRPDDPQLGPADAASTLVVFSDPECPACRAFERRLERDLLPRFDGRLRVVFKALPLVDLHPHALAASRALEAARIQGAWAALHAELLETDLARVDWPALARELELDVERFESDRTSTLVDERLSADRKAASALGVDRTPAVFLDRRAVPFGALALDPFWADRADAARGTGG